MNIYIYRDRYIDIDIYIYIQLQSPHIPSNTNDTVNMSLCVFREVKPTKVKFLYDIDISHCSD